MVMGSSSLASQGSTGASEPLWSRASNSAPSTVRGTADGTLANWGSSSGDTKTLAAPLWLTM